MRIFVISLSLLTVIILLIFIINRSRLPMLEVYLLNIQLVSPDDKWERYLSKRGLQLGADTLQLEVDFRISNRNQRNIPLFGIYSKRLNSLALGVRGINYYFDVPIIAGQTAEYTIYYLIKGKDKDIVSKIKPERDFKAYASFKHDLISESVESTWRGIPIIASSLGVGYSRVVDARNE